MKISVVVCVKNEEERLRDCLKSVYSNEPDEVILVDGDSTDKTLDVAREFPDIIIYESKNSSLKLIKPAFQMKDIDLKDSKK